LIYFHLTAGSTGELCVCVCVRYIVDLLDIYKHS